MRLQIGLQGYANMPDALAGLSRAERITYCNDAWRNAHPRVAILDFSRDRKMMSVLVGGGSSGGDGSPFTLFTKVRLSHFEQTCCAGKRNLVSGWTTSTQCL